MINRSLKWPDQALRASLAPPGAAQFVLRASHPLCCMRRLLQHFSGFCLGMLWEQGFSVWSLDFHNSPHFLWEWGDREAPWNCCPGVGKVDTPMPCRKSGICLGWDGFQSPRQEPDKLLLLLYFLLVLSLLTLWLDRQSLFVLSCEPFFMKRHKHITARLLHFKQLPNWNYSRDKTLSIYR